MQNSEKLKVKSDKIRKWLYRYLKRLDKFEKDSYKSGKYIIVK